MKKIIQRTAGLLVHTLFTSFVIQDVFCQSITGKIQEVGGAPLTGVNVLLLSDGDSTLIKSAVSDPSGVYVLENVSPGHYMISASILGFKRAYLLPVVISKKGEVVQVADFIMESLTTQLNEVAVTAKRPFVEQQTDRTVINVANSIIAGGGTALEVLEKAPGVDGSRPISRKLRKIASI
ncbi:carboxypeptidase-like regulatory domain-containing protein [Dyadobacter chenwenxiniae]|uniref:Carboxypeptidase-like regulatory domain-containing protein n=1 Tax=Dyadobacter chenwenxiniae TaxID=2906456 RepID=A0A9X1PQR0_9BACT|nr:carboxypeptidase-like regulatory domain-containing protein [Dyadobacter chenwenxiniae]MCF0064699.1 carboxypeptidase-like regulatory domain-containing protein [Dyadobacter chenwenxiniae]UON84247.1 carboxypeptidase-like regulatory domain-containing protein [Dyadobacter chenwenxiniae]